MCSRKSQTKENKLKFVGTRQHLAPVGFFFCLFALVLPFPHKQKKNHLKHLSSLSFVLVRNACVGLTRHRYEDWKQLVRPFTLCKSTYFQHRWLLTTLKTSSHSTARGNAFQCIPPVSYTAPPQLCSEIIAKLQLELAWEVQYSFRKFVQTFREYDYL